MSTSYDSTYSNQVLSQDDISAEMMSVASKLESLLPITPEQRQLLLLKFNWDIESLRNSIQEYADANSFLLGNGVCLDNTVTVIHKSECAICCATGRVLGLRCQHMACLYCWCEHLATKIKDNQCMLSCMEFGCNMLISNETLGRFLYCPKLNIAHRELIKDSYIKSDSSLAWCNKKCGMAIRRSNNDIVSCSCGSTFCFLCRADSHYPATCLQFRLWEKQRMDFGQETSSWISSNTKDCPRCFAPIQKDQGCNHMKCARCRYGFCWACSKSWTFHGAACKPFDKKVAQLKLNHRGNAQLFAQHLARFEHHKKFYKQDPPGLLDLETRNTRDECRRILMGSYVFGYYLKNGKYKSSLEKHQQKLEIAVENLGVFRTGSSQKMFIEECLTLRDALLAHCATGAEHVNLEEIQPVKRASTDNCIRFSIAICFIVIMIMIVMALICFFV